MLPALRVISHIIRVARLTGGFYAPVFICIDRAHFYGYLHSDCLVIFCYAMFHIFCSWGGGIPTDGWVGVPSSGFYWFPWVVSFSGATFVIQVRGRVSYVCPVSGCQGSRWLPRVFPTVW